MMSRKQNEHHNSHDGGLTVSMPDVHRSMGVCSTLRYRSTSKPMIWSLADTKCVQSAQNVVYLGVFNKAVTYSSGKYINLTVSD